MAEKNTPNKQDNKPHKSLKDKKESLSERLKKWFVSKKNEYAAEFKRIVWPSREELLKETVTVIVVSLLFGLYITVLDGAFGFLYSQFANLASTLL